MAINVITDFSKFDINSVQSAHVPQYLEMTSTANTSANAMRFIIDFYDSVNSILIARFKIFAEGNAPSSIARFDFAKIARCFFNRVPFPLLDVVGLTGASNLQYTIMSETYPVVDEPNNGLMITFDLQVGEEVNGVDTYNLVTIPLVRLYDGLPPKNTEVVGAFFGQPIFNTTVFAPTTIFAIPYKRRMYTHTNAACLLPVAGFTNNATKQITYRAADEYGNVVGSNIFRSAKIGRGISHYISAGRPYIAAKYGSNADPLDALLADSSLYVTMQGTGVSEDEIFVQHMCKPFYEFYYKNRYGFHEQFIFEFGKVTTEVERTSYSAMRNGSYNMASPAAPFNYDGDNYAGMSFLQNQIADRTVSNRVMHSLEVVHKMLEPNEYLAFEDFVQSSEIYMCMPIANAGGITQFRYIPVSVLDSSTNGYSARQQKADVVSCKIQIHSYNTQQG